MSAALGALAVSLSVGAAQAEETPRPLPPARDGEAFDLRLSAGGAAAEYSQHSSRMAHLEAISISGGLRWGGFVTPHLLLGYELLLGRHTDVGTPAINPVYRTEFNPRPHEGYSVAAPLGAFAELYPIEGAGLYLGGSASAGLLFLPDLADESSGLMLGYAGELGYDLSGSGRHGLGFFLRYSHWSGFAVISDHGDELVANEVSLGARWAFAP